MVRKYCRKIFSKKIEKVDRIFDRKRYIENIQKNNWKTRERKERKRERERKIKKARERKSERVKKIQSERERE